METTDNENRRRIDDLLTMLTAEELDAIRGVILAMIQKGE